jgi:Icc-related predicted phosphoesterase
VKAFAEKVGASLLVTGHQPQENGFTQIGEQMLIVDSSHNQGVFAPLSTSQTYTAESLSESVRKIVALEFDD